MAPQPTESPSNAHLNAAPLSTTGTTSGRSHATKVGLGIGLSILIIIAICLALWFVRRKRQLAAYGRASSKSARDALALPSYTNGLPSAENAPLEMRGPIGQVAGTAAGGRDTMGSGSGGGLHHGTQ